MRVVVALAGRVGDDEEIAQRGGCVDGPCPRGKGRTVG
jgi:hypothetical protein